MKKLSQIIMVMAVVLSPVTSSGSASATNTIENTGPGSNNSITDKNSYNCEIKNDTDITVRNKNEQNAVSGSGKVTKNTNGGSATSGSAFNENGTTFGIEITNGNVCTVASVTPGEGSTPGQGTTPAPVQTPAPTPAPILPGGMGAAPVNTNGGKGAVVAPVAAPQVAIATSLPDTSADSTFSIIAGLIAVLGMAIVGSRVAVNTYSRMNA